MFRASHLGAAHFPKLGLPVPIPLSPMEAERVSEIPVGKKWQYEPKWDGFRSIIFRAGDKVILQSKAAQDLTRYFPEIVTELKKIRSKSFVLDAEIVLEKEGRLSFDDLQLRLHPAESRIRRLASEIPATLQVFDLLAEGKKSYLEVPLSERRKKLERFFSKNVSSRSSIKLSPYSCKIDQARQWLTHFSEIGLDGIIAKDANEAYHSDDRKGMLKVKLFKTADCVVAGFRYQADSKSVGALTLGLYDHDGYLHHVGSTSSFSAKERKELLSVLKPFLGGKGFTGRAPGRSRWSKEELPWIPLKPELVCEVRYDYFNGERFRHGTKFLRWRPEKKARACTFDQLLTRRAA